MTYLSLPSRVSEAPGQPTSGKAKRDSEHVVAQLRTSISDSNLSLDAKLDSIVQAAQLVASADGAAIAMQRGDLVVCEARSGEMAPELGLELDADSQISGECLQTGETVLCHDTYNDPRVDAEVCRSVGLRSVVVIPVGRKPAVSGVLEAFSALSNAFDDTQIELLEELAELVISAQAPQAESGVEVASEKLAPAESGGEAIGSAFSRFSSWLHTRIFLLRVASEKLAPAESGVEVASEKRANTRKRNLIVAAVAVLALLSWLVFKGKSNSHPLSAAAQQPVGDASASAVTDRSSAGVLEPNPSPVEDPRSATPNLPSPMVKASETEKDSLTGDVTVRKFAPAPASSRNTSANVPNGISRPPAQTPDHADETAPPLPAVATTFETVPGGLLLAAPNKLPMPPLQVSQGLSGGTIEYRVDPIYPDDDLVPGEGRVLLQAVVAEDGTVHDLKVIKGHPLLARAAIQAVSQWRYRPYLLDGQPVRMTIEITLTFSTFSSHRN
jgi:L-methionine (R)-S-oxide reductase